MTGTDAIVERILTSYDSITVVGASATPAKAAHYVPAHMQRHGWRIVPVNPHADVILGEPVYRTLAQVPGPVGLVNVFRPSGQTPDIARQAVAAGATALWLQLGIASAEARAIADGGRAALRGRPLPDHRAAPAGPGGAESRWPVTGGSRHSGTVIDPAIESHYGTGYERARLFPGGTPSLEFVRSMELLDRLLPAPPAQRAGRRRRAGHVCRPAGPARLSGAPGGSGAAARRTGPRGAAPRIRPPRSPRRSATRGNCPPRTGRRTRCCCSGRCTT